MPRARARAIAAGLITALALLPMLLITPIAGVEVDAGYKDHSFGPAGTPTGDKPQSQVWFADGSWWGGLFVSGSDDYRIHKLDTDMQAWSATDAIVDERNDTHGDYLWDEASDTLYVASVHADSNDAAIKFFRFSYSAGTYTSAFPDGIDAAFGPSETVTIAKDSQGQLWINYTNPNGPYCEQDDSCESVEPPPSGPPLNEVNRNVMVATSDDDGATWDSFVLPNSSEISSDDISAITAFGGNSVGIMWSNGLDSETSTSFNWSSHADGADVDAPEAWSAEAEVSSGATTYAEDHINLKLTATASGTVLAAVKTNGPDSDADIMLLRRDGPATWTEHAVVHGGGPTRPQVVVDQTNADVYVLYTLPESPPDQAIYYKSSPLSTLDFDPGTPGTPFIQSNDDPEINNVSTAKHTVTAASGLLATASDESTEFYFHGFLELEGTPEPPPPAAPTNLSATAGDGEVALSWTASTGATSYNVKRGTTDGGPYSTIASPTTTSHTDTTVTNGTTYYYVVSAENADGESNDSSQVSATPSAEPPPPPPPPPPDEDHPFTDIDGHQFEADIVWLYNAGITSGCSSTRFCPDNAVNREQMASFLVRALDLPASSTNYFGDDDGSIHHADINALRASGITGGCGGTNYCPKQVVNREQMASFLTRALDLAPSSDNEFTDDDASIHHADINALAASGITGGCGGNNYCPLGAVTRGQMAAFLHRASPRF
ncbi:MAG: S-layer homology domain-containing protein [Candidatus Limnocylindria bacterium]